MVKVMIELMMGRGGRFLLEIYNEYHLILNVLIILYGLALIWAHINLRQSVHKMEKMILNIAVGSESTPDPAAIYAAFVTQWNRLSGKQKTFIPSRNDLWFTIITPRDLIEVLRIKPEYVSVVLSKDRGSEQIAIGSKQVYRVWELYRHQLLMGVRARRMEPDFQLEMQRKNSLTKKETLRAKPETKN